MSRFDRYLLSQFMALFGFFSLVLVAIYWLNRTVKLVDQLLSDGHSALVFAEMSALVLPQAIRMVLPLSAFVAVVFVTNRLMTDSELVVMRATGFSAWRLARPVAYFGAIVSVMMLVLVHGLVPASRAKFTVEQSNLSADTTASLMTPGSFMHPDRDVTLFIRSISDRGELEDLFLADDRKPEARTIFNARRAILARSATGPKLVMYDGTAQTMDAQGRLALTRFDNFTYSLAASTSDVRPATIDALTSLELMSPPPAAAAAGTPDNDALANSLPPARRWAEVQSRTAQALLSVVTAIIGFAALLTGSFSRFGLWRQIGLAVALLIVVQGVNTAGVAAADRGLAWPAFVAPLLGCAIGGGLLWWADRPTRRKAALTPTDGGGAA